MAHTSLKPLNNRELSTFCSQMSMMLSAGISAMESVSILREGLEDPGAQEILAQVSHSLEAGESLFAALSAPAGAFPRYFFGHGRHGREGRTAGYGFFLPGRLL